VTGAAAVSVCAITTTVYGIDDDLVTAVGWPTGAVLLVASIMVMLRYGMRRRQPGWSWLALAALGWPSPLNWKRSDSASRTAPNPSLRMQ